MYRYTQTKELSFPAQLDYFQYSRLEELMNVNDDTPVHLRLAKVNESEAKLIISYDPDFVDDPTAYAFSYLLQNCADAVCLLPLEEAPKRIQEKVESARRHVNNDPEWMAESAHIYPDEYIFWY